MGTSVAETRNFYFLFVCLILSCLAAGCSSSQSSNGQGPQSGVQFTAPTSSPTIGPGQSVNFTVQASGGVTWQLQSSGSGKPPGELTNTTDTSATYRAPTLTSPPTCSASSGPPSPLNVGVVAVSKANTTESAVISVRIVQALPCVATVPTFPACPAVGSVLPPPPSLPFSQLTEVGSFTTFVIGDGGYQVGFPFGAPPFTWKITSGALPIGLTLSAGSDSSSVLISGTPVSSSCSTFSLQVTDATGVASTPVPFSLVVLPNPLKAQVSPYSPTYLGAKNAGVPYQPTSLTVSGGVAPYTWALADPANFPLPPNLTVTTGVGSAAAYISGTPTAQDLQIGTYPVPFLITDSQQPYPALATPSVTLSVQSLAESCTPAGDIQPVPGVNGGVLGAGNVPSDSYLVGSLAFWLHGFDANGPVVIAGAVTLDGAGNITGGVEDITRKSGSQTLTIQPAGSVYTAGVVGLKGPNYSRGCMTLADSSGGTTAFSFSLGGCSNRYAESGVTVTSDNACGMTQNGQGENIAAGFFTNGRIVEFDDATGNGTRLSGILRLQDQSSFSSGLSGPYAFGLSGRSTGGHYAMAGSFRASSGNLNSVAADFDDAGTPGTQLTGGSGTYNIAATGRGTATLTVGKANFDLALYMVNQNEAIVISTDALSDGHPIIGGEAVTTSSSFSGASLQNSHMFHIDGSIPGCKAEPSGCADVSVGTLLFDGIGSFTGTEFQDQAATLGTSSLSGAYSVDPSSGRTVFSAPEIGQSLGPHTFVAYVIPKATNLTRATCLNPASCITGFLVGTDNAAQSGILEFQTSLATPPPPFLARLLAGDYAYGTNESLDPATANLEGSVSALPSSTSLTAGSFTRIDQDVSYADPGYCLQPGCLLLFPDESLTGSYSINPNGTGNFGGNTVSVTNGRVVFYIDESPLNLHPTVVVVEQ